MKSRRRRRRSSCFVQRHRLSIPLLKGAERGGDEAGEAGGEAAEALPDEDDDRPGDAVFQPRGGDVRAERLDEGFEAGAEQKSGGCGGWGGHGCKNPMRGWGWARIFVSFAPMVAWLAIGQNSGGLGGNGVTRAGSYDSGPQCAHHGHW